MSSFEYPAASNCKRSASVIVQAVSQAIMSAQKLKVMEQIRMYV
jgi:hypothetical protein